MSDEWKEQMSKVSRELVTLERLLPRPIRLVLCIMLAVWIFSSASDIGVSVGKAIYYLTH